MLWLSKINNNDFYVGRRARIYYKDLKEFVEGNLTCAYRKSTLRFYNIKNETFFC